MHTMPPPVRLRHRVQVLICVLICTLLQIKETQPLKGRNAVLAEMLHNTFTDVCCCSSAQQTVANGGVGGPGLTLVLSQSGLLLQINENRCIAKWVDLKVNYFVCCCDRSTEDEMIFFELPIFSAFRPTLP